MEYKKEDVVVDGPAEIIRVSPGDSMKDYGSLFLSTGALLGEEPKIRFAFKSNGDVIFNDRKLTTDGEITAAFRTFVNVVIDCDHKDASYVGGTRAKWCPLCGSFAANHDERPHEWKRPTGVRW